VVGAGVLVPLAGCQSPKAYWHRLGSTS